MLFSTEPEAHQSTLVYRRIHLRHRQVGRLSNGAHFLLWLRQQRRPFRWQWEQPDRPSGLFPERSCYPGATHSGLWLFPRLFALPFPDHISEQHTFPWGGARGAQPSLRFTPQNVAQQNYSHWQILPPTGFLVNGVSVGPIVAGNFSDWIIDSGSTLTFLPASLLNPIAQTMRTVTGLQVFFSLPDSGGSQSLYIVLSNALGFGLTDADYLAYLPSISLQSPGVTLTA
jgi:hypothetical protein